MSSCKHCRCRINPAAECEICRKKLKEQCITCHLEVQHDLIFIQNIHICSSPLRRQDFYDYDAYGIADLEPD